MEGETPTAMIHLSNSKFVASSLVDKESLLNLYEENGAKDTTYVINYPQINNEILTPHEAKRIFEYRIFYNETNNRIVVVYVYIDLIDIYDIDLNLKARIHGPDQFIPELDFYEIDGVKNARLILNKTKLSYQSSHLTSDRIWALYNGRPIQIGQEFPNRILCFDYSGNPLHIYHLEYPVFAFCVDEKENAIYGISEQPERCIVRFPLPY